MWVFPGGTVVKNMPTNAGDARDTGWVPELGRSPGEGNAYPLQYSPWGCKESNTTERLSLEFPSQL